MSCSSVIISSKIPSSSSHITSPISKPSSIVCKPMVSSITCSRTTKLSVIFNLENQVDQLSTVNEISPKPSDLKITSSIQAKNHLFE